MQILLSEIYFLQAWGFLKTTALSVQSPNRSNGTKKGRFKSYSDFEDFGKKLYNGKDHSFFPMWLEIVTDFGGEFSFPPLPLDGAGDAFFCLLFFPPLPPPDFGAFLLLSNFGEFSLLELFCCLTSDLFDLLLFSCLTSFFGDFL